jgi:hypothetical protein
MLDYYLGPTGIPDRLRAANEILNPIVAISDAGQDLRRGEYLGALTNTMAAAAPIVGGRMAIKAARGVPSLAPREYDEATSALTETLTGVSAPKPSDVTDMTRRQFLTGAAAAGGTAAMGPDIVELARKAAPDIARQAGPWEALVARARNALNNPVPMPRTVVEGPNGPVSYEPEEIMDLRRVRQDELNMLFDDVYEEAISDPEGFADTILRKTDPEDTLEKIGINQRMKDVFVRSGLDYKALSKGALREYPDEVAKKANVSVEDVRRYVEEMDEDYQDYLSMKGYDRLVDYNPDLVQKLETSSVGIARDKLLNGGIDDVDRLVGSASAQLGGVDSEAFELWKALERKRRQLANDEIENVLNFGLIDDETAEVLRKEVNELSAQDIRDLFLSY